MNKRIINEINQIKSMMGLKESEVDEQSIKSAIDGFRQGIKNTLNKNSETSTNTEEDDYYNGKPIVEILNEIDETKSNYGTIDVNGETLYYGVFLSPSRELARSKADLFARKAMADDLGEKKQSNNVTTTTQTQKRVSTVIDQLFETSDGKYKRYILIKQL